MTNQLSDLFPDDEIFGGESSTEETVGTASPDEVGEDEETTASADEGAVENEFEEEGEVDENPPAEVDVEELQRQVKRLEEEKRMLQSKKDREIYELQQKLEKIEKQIFGNDDNNDAKTTDFSAEEISDLLYENPAEAIEKVLSAKLPEYLEKTLPKIQEKINEMKRMETQQAWERGLMTAADYVGEDVLNDLNHPFTKAMGEFIKANAEKYMKVYNPDLVKDAYKYAKKKVGVKRDNAVKGKKAATAVSKTAKSHKPSSKPTIEEAKSLNEIFASDEW